MESRELANRITSKKTTTVVDVRTIFEFRNGHIPGALHAPTWNILLGRAPLPADKSTALVVTCEHGPRAHLARIVLGLFGYHNVELLDGHMAAWRDARYPLDR
jgi:rhodanese-related sulfurtransferase